ncbi:hypothetical protein MMC13_007121 [Lambiella insularis]|nr:hypothetical protein [Lambiella insularis]
MTDVESPAMTFDDKKWEMEMGQYPRSPRTTGGQKTPMTPRTMAFNTLDGYSIEDDQQITINASFFDQDESPKGIPTPYKSIGKPRRKHDAGGETTNKEKAAKAVHAEITGSPPQSSSSHIPRSPPFLATAGATSPVLTALGDNSGFRRTPVNTSAWPHGAPYGGSPPQQFRDEVSVAGSPKGASLLHNEEVRGGFSHNSPATSPRPAYRIPARPDNSYQSFGDYLSSSPAQGRPISMPVQFSKSPPPPHHPQPHFYGVHATELGLPSRQNVSKGSGATGFYALDSLDSIGGEASGMTNNLLLVAVEGGLVIYGVEKNKLHVIGRLEGFRGEVVSAKILPCRPSTDPYQQRRPLIAAIVHGPLAPPPAPQLELIDTNDEGFYNSSPHDLLQHNNAVYSGQPPVQYQTTVEVYSLDDRQLVATLYRSPPVNTRPYYGGPFPDAPPPIGKLHLDAGGRFLIVSSGSSGEVYIFEVSSKALEPSEQAFKCLAKYWTSIPARKGRSYSSSSTSSETESSHEGSPKRAISSNTPIVSLSHRWLAIAPPVSSSGSTLHGALEPTVARNKPLWITSHTPPAQFQVTCELDIPTEETLFNRVARDVTQEVIKGARWVGDQGVQAWKNYWNKAPDPHAISEKGGFAPAFQQPQQNFPPTHANDDRARVTSQPTVISIIDLEKLSESQVAKAGAEANYQPIATFALPGGCSFVSLNPTGLSLLTASSKGDVQYVWDLMRMVHGPRNNAEATENSQTDKGPAVRQIARFTRMTVANIVDVAWTEPRGERLAMVTDRGTVHIFDLPANAFHWPPLRRAARPATAPSGQITASTASDNVGAQATTAGAFSNAVNMVSGRAQPLLAAVRGRPPSITSAVAGFGGFNITAGAAAGAGVKGSKAVAAGISKSVGAATGTVNTIRHLGENRLHIPGPPELVARGCLRWLTGKDYNLAIVGDGILRVHDVRSSTIVKAGRRRPSVVGGHPTEFPIPGGPQVSNQGYSGQGLVGSKFSSLAGFWASPAARTKIQHPRISPHSTHPLSHAEIETNAPYQPFHTDHRINLHVYNQNSDDGDIHHLHDSKPWVFGEDIPSTQITSGASVSSEQSSGGRTSDEPSGMENVVSLEGDVEGGRQVIVTTRRKRRGKGETEGEEGIFEDTAEWVDFMDERV